MTAFEKRLNDPDPKVHLPAARAWSVYEGSCSTLLPSPQTVAAFGEERHALGLSRIEAHYFRNGIFQIGRASCRERGCQYVSISVGAVSLTKTSMKISS